MPKFIETTNNQIYRVVSAFGDSHYDCIEVKRSKGGFVDKAKARSVLILKAYIIRAFG